MSSTTIEEPAGPFCWREKAWGGLRALGNCGISKFNAWRKSIEQNSLEKALAHIIETANGHRAKGLPRGAPAYVVLRDKADSKIQTFALKWRVDKAIIKAQAPALADLDRLCVPDKVIPTGIKLLVGLLGAILSLVLLGAASGLISAAHDWVMHIVIR
jgi:hypothetical protein